MDKKLTGQQETFLDLFRILAAFFVVIGHSLGFYQLTVFQDDRYFCYWKEIGVVMLFLLSGFLLAYSTETKYNSGGIAIKFM